MFLFHPCMFSVVYFGHLWCRLLICMFDCYCKFLGVVADLLFRELNFPFLICFYFHRFSEDSFGDVGLVFASECSR